MSKKPTDHESTARIQGLGYPIVRIETEVGDDRAHIIWKYAPDAVKTAQVDALLGGRYLRMSHGT